MIRSFLAIELPRMVARRIEEVQQDLKTSASDVRWVNPHQIHLTLKFFGNIQESQVDSIVTSIQDPVRKTPPFLLGVQGMGAFPNPKHPRVIWVGLVDSKQALVSLQKEVELALQRVGFQPEDRLFSPHLTLGRMRSSRGRGALSDKIEQHRDTFLGDFQVERVVLFKSDLKPSGPVYTALRDATLGG